MESKYDFGPVQLDALREVANIGAGHAATALSQLTNRSIGISVPEIEIARFEEVAELLGDPQEVMAAAAMHLLGDVTGCTLLMIPEVKARALCDLMLYDTPTGDTGFGELEQSSFREAANILGGSYVNALAAFLELSIGLSVPTFTVDASVTVLSAEFLAFGNGRDHVLCVVTDFTFADDQPPLRGYLLTFPDLMSLKAILNAMQAA
jgi:chemotaxis protein CheC